MSEHQQYGAGGWGPAPQWAPPGPPRRRRTVPVLLGAVALVVLVAVGLTAWTAGRSAQVASAPTPVTATRYQSGDPAAAAAVEPGLVDVDTVIGYQGAQAAGTGIVLTADGEVLTNNHVVAGATRIQVTDIGNGRTYAATVVGYDRSRDVAVLQLQGATGLTTAPLGDSATVAVGDPVVGVGNAGGVGGTPSTAAGTVTALDRPITASDESGSAEQLTGLIQVDADIQAGDSGGPLVNSAGQVVGMDTAASTPSRTATRHHRSATGQTAAVQGFAIPIDDALSVARQIESGAASSTVHIGESAMLGVSVTDSGAGQGAVVGQVLAGSPAAQAGVVAGDAIVAVNGQSVDSAAALTTLLDGTHPGDSVSVTWVDQSQQQQDATVTLVTGPTG